MLSNFFYKCFVEIANNGNISIAAEKLNYSQGGLSHTINRAEEELGFKLWVGSGFICLPSGNQ